MKQSGFSFTKCRKHCESNVKLRGGFLRQHRLPIHLCSAGNNSGSPASFSPVSRLFIQFSGLLFGASCCRCPVDEMNVLLKQMRDPQPIDFLFKSLDSSSSKCMPTLSIFFFFFVESPNLFREMHMIEGYFARFCVHTWDSTLLNNNSFIHPLLRIKRW